MALIQNAWDPEVFRIFFRFLENLHRLETSRGWDSNLNTGFVYVTYVPSIYNLEVVVYNIFNNFGHKTSFAGWNFPLWVSCWCSQNIGFWSTSDFQTNDVQPILVE